ncbi:MAG: ATP-binding cassette domain-containing protein [Parachlamydia sp.]|nr:ATP-binding cassette domain-containing protein [Parachlamydia sp.]
MSIISVNHLFKQFRIAKRKEGLLGSIKNLFVRDHVTRTALDRISFQIQEGELVGYIGPNGAGKSTTVKILSGILVPDGGSVEVMGKTPWKHRQETVQQLGVVFGQRTQLWWDLPVIESFNLLRDIYRIPQKQYERTRDSLIASLELSKIVDVPARQLSLGQRMRCDIAASLLHSPKILFLDEPTIGLDAVSKFAVRDFIRKLNQEQKVTIFLTTHDMDDIESLCRRIIILNEGRIFLNGPLELLRSQIAPERRLILDLVDERTQPDDPDAQVIKRENQRVWLRYNPYTTATPQLISRLTAKYPIRDLYVENPPIEEIIANFYRNANL